MTDPRSSRRHGSIAAGVVLIGAGAGLVSVGHRFGEFIMAVAGITLAALGALIIWARGIRS